MKFIFKFWKELKRRNVHKGIISYVVFSWVLLQVISVLGSLINTPSWLGKTVLISLFVFLPFWLFFSWFYDITPDGIKKTEAYNSEIDDDRSERVGKRLNTFIISFLIIAVILLVFDRTRLSVQNNQTSNNIVKENLNSIAVLPFKDISVEKNQTYFSDGLAEEIIIALSKITDIKVTSRTSAFSFKNKAVDIPTIAKKLSVNYILEGSIRTQDSIVRVRVHLIDAKNDSYAWSKTWDKKLKNIFQIQNEISTTIADKMSIEVSANNFKEVKETNPKAYKLYLQARYEFKRNHDEVGTKKAKELLQKSLEIDSTYAPSWELMSRIYHFQNNLGVIDINKGYKAALNAGNKAIALDSTLASVYDIMGTIAIDYEKDYKKANDYVTKGISIEPNNPEVMDRAAEVALINGNLEKALEYNQKIVALNPIDPGAFYSLSNTYYRLKNYVASEKAILKTIELDPSGYIDYHVLSNALLFQDKTQEALEAAKKEKLVALRLQSLAMVYYKMGNKKQANKYLQELISKYETDFSFQIASVYASYKDIDSVFHWLDKAIEYNDFGVIEAKSDPLYDFAKTDPRWKVFLKKIGL